MSRRKAQNCRTAIPPTIKRWVSLPQFCYDTLNRLKWTGKLGQCIVIVLHRGAEDNRKAIPGDRITEVKKSYFSYMNGRETTIPMHRVLEIRVGGEVVWKRTSKTGRAGFH